MNLQDLWQQELLFALNCALEDADLGLTADHSEFVYVDGEEGDFGVIRYKDASGQVVATKTVDGGDSAHLELTDYGKPLVAAKLMDVFKETLTKKLELAPGTL